MTLPVVDETPRYEVGFDDDFSDVALDTDRWLAVAGTDLFAVVSEKAEADLSAATFYAMEHAFPRRSSPSLTEAFRVEVGWEADGFSPVVGESVYAMVHLLGTYAYDIRRQTTNPAGVLLDTIGVYKANVLVAEVSAADTSGSFAVELLGTTMRFYYDVGAGWVEVPGTVQTVGDEESFTLTPVAVTTALLAGCAARFDNLLDVYHHRCGVVGDSDTTGAHVLWDRLLDEEALAVLDKVRPAGVRIIVKEA